MIQCLNEGNKVRNATIWFLPKSFDMTLYKSRIYSFKFTETILVLFSFTIWWSTLLRKS